jgi:hypothetical protein
MKRDRNINLFILDIGKEGMRNEVEPERSNG